MVQVLVSVPDWLLNSSAADILKCSKEPGDWVYHGCFGEEMKPVSCQHETTTEPVAMFEVQENGKTTAGLGKCHVCKKAHWLLHEPSHDGTTHSVHFQ